MQIEIKDDFDLKKIMISGQCFRVREVDNKFTFITGDEILEIKQLTDTIYEVSSDQEIWKMWHNYFDLDRNYSEIRRDASRVDEVIKDACEFAKGIRVLRQDPWEMIITFILSQRKSIPAISLLVENLSNAYGREIKNGIKTFPTPLELANVSVDELKSLGLGYRAPYVSDAIFKANNGELDIKHLKTLDDASLHTELLKIYGVGEKVSNCIELFGFQRVNKAPIDVWIARIIEEDFNGVNPFPKFPDNAGIIQQYLFYYAKYRDK